MMKINALKLCVILFIACSLGAFAQPPQGIPYQAVARNGQGQPLANLPVKIRFSILDSTLTGTAVYSETHQPTTSALGLFSVNVGMGNPSQGTFSGINWGVNAKFLKVELDTTASGSNYIDLGTQQMMSVPYALFASQASSVFNPSTLSGNLITSNHGYLNVINDTMLIFSKPTFLEVKISGGKGGDGGDSYQQGSHTNLLYKPGGVGGYGGYSAFCITVYPEDTIYLRIGQNGIDGCDYCTYVHSSCSQVGLNGTDGTESIFSINSPDHAAFLVKATGGQSGKASICAYSFLQQRCECQSSGVNGVNGTIINGNGSESKGLLLQSNGVNVAQITLKW